MSHKNIVNVTDINIKDLRHIFDQAQWIKSNWQRDRQKFNTKFSTLLHNKLMITDFFKPSTRTRFSFESAMFYLGGGVISTENAETFSSIYKGESLADNARVISQFCDIIVGRFVNEGDAKITAENSLVPVINGGDGEGEHPTQAYTDLFTIVEGFNIPISAPPSSYIAAGDLTITFFGDNKRSRTVHSLVKLINNWFPSSKRFMGDNNLTLNFISPPELQISREFLDEHIVDCESVAINLSDKIVPHLKSSDVVYVTRSQDQDDQHKIERLHDWDDILSLDRQCLECGFADNGNTNPYSLGCPGKELDPNYVLWPELLEHLPSRALIMHPLPRNQELPREIDSDPRAVYFEQAANGLFVRMALLLWLFQQDK